MGKSFAAWAVIPARRASATRSERPTPRMPNGA
jgi:hypothetical protein